MRIIKKPFVKQVGSRRVTHFKCSDGNTYLITELAEKIGLSRNSFLNRLKKKGWDHPNILDGKVDRGLLLGSERSDGNEEWQRLTRPEIEEINLPGPGLLEQLYL